MSTFWRFLTIGIIVISLCLTTEETSTLRLVQLIYRHGDRTPVHTFPTDPHRSYWPDDDDKLTPIGMQQLFELGQYLRHRYDKFIPKTFDPMHIFVRSTGYQRTVYSAYCKLAGFYSEHRNSTLYEELPKLMSQNISIVTVPPIKDIFMRISSHCPVYERLWNEKQQSSEWMHLEKSNKKLFEYIGNHTGLNNVNLMSAFSVADPISCWVSHNKTFPQWLTQTIAKRILHLGSLKHYLKFSTPALQRLRGGPLVKQMIKNMELKINNIGNKARRRMYSYSAHDGTISAVMNYLGVFNMKKSPYGSCLIFELHDIPNKEVEHNFIVKMFIRNSTIEQPYQLRIPNCETNCPFHRFKSLVSWNLPGDIRKECFKDDAV